MTMTMSLSFSITVCNDALVVIILTVPGLIFAYGMVKLFTRVGVLICMKLY